MKPLHLAAFCLVAAPVLAQQSGVSHPTETSIDSTPAPQAAVPVVSAPVMVVAPTEPRAAITAEALPRVASVDDSSPAVTLKRHDLAKFEADPDAGIVTEVPQKPNELSEGTLLRVRLKTSIETATTQPGSIFTAELTEPVQHMGRIVVPAGSTLEGRVTEVRGGKRFHGAALIHLQAERIILPDGTRMPIHAAVIDTDRYGSTRTDAEGNVIRKDHVKETLAMMSLTTGSAAAAGGVIGGVPGALVGAGIGAGVSTVWWLKQDRQTQLPAETLVVMALTSPMEITPLVREPEFSTAPAVRSEPMTQEEIAPAKPAPAAAQSFVPAN